MLPPEAKGFSALRTGGLFGPMLKREAQKTPRRIAAAEIFIRIPRLKQYTRGTQADSSRSAHTHGSQRPQVVEPVIRVETSEFLGIAVAPADGADFHAGSPAGFHVGRG